MTCGKCGAKKLNIDWIKVQKGIYGIWEMADIQTNEIYGSISDIMIQYKEPQRTMEMEERNIFFGKTLDYLFKLSLMDVESYKFKLKDGQTYEDYVEEIKKMDNVVVFD